jgi:CheY-like chemotaxis protein
LEHLLTWKIMLLYNSTVLVAEDDENDRFFLNRACEKAGVALQVRFVPDGVAAVDYLRRATDGAERMPALLLLDLRMPGLDGFQVLEWLREHPASRPASVVVFTSSSDPRDQERALALGADTFAIKPNDGSEYVGVAREMERWVHALPMVGSVDARSM